MDAIIELDDQLHIIRVNPATEKAFRCRAEKMTGQDFRRFVSPDDAGTLVALIAELDGRPEGQQSRWIPGGLTARCPEGEPFLPKRRDCLAFRAAPPEIHDLNPPQCARSCGSGAKDPVAHDRNRAAAGRIAGPASRRGLDRRKSGASAGLTRHRSSRRDRRDRAHSGRDKNRQGTGSARNPCSRHTPGASADYRELRGDSRHAH